MGNLTISLLSIEILLAGIPLLDAVLHHNVVSAPSRDNQFTIILTGYSVLTITFKALAYSLDNSVFKLGLNTTAL